MTQEQLNKLVKELGIAPDNILREEAEMAFLNELSGSMLGDKVVFYGGTALRLVYNSPRFSEDIDLFAIKLIVYGDFKTFLKTIIKANPNWKLSDIKNKRQTMFALFLVREDKLKHNFSLKIEIHKPASPSLGGPAVKVELEDRLALIKSPVSIFEPLLLVPSLQKLKDFKIDALRGRKKARDIFDLWYIAQSLRENFVLPRPLPDYSEREFKNELQKFLPKKYYQVIPQLYGEVNKKN